MKNKCKVLEWWIESGQCPSNIYLKDRRRLLGPFNRENEYDWKKVNHGLMRIVARNFTEKLLKIPYKRKFGWFRVVPDEIMLKEMHKLENDVANEKLRVIVF